MASKASKEAEAAKDAVAETTKGLKEADKAIDVQKAKKEAKAAEKEEVNKMWKSKEQIEMEESINAEVEAGRERDLATMEEQQTNQQAKIASIESTIAAFKANAVADADADAAAEPSVVESDNIEPGASPEQEA